MIEEGIVVDCKVDKTLVKVEKGSECKGCLSIEICKPSTDKAGMVVTVLNPLSAKKGDRVLISVDTRGLLKVSLMIYIFPLISFIAGILLGERFGQALVPWINRDILSAITGIIMLLMAFVVIRGYGNKWSRDKNRLPRITRVITG
ncbi:MAG: SoxR reducing system RseC family protein [Thermodesulfobacteriota bacterium]